MREAWSQMEQAWRDTLVHKVEAASFSPLCQLYGVPLPATEVDEKSWAGVLALVAYGSRGNFETTYRSVQAALSFLNVSVEGRVDSSEPDVLVSNTPWPANSVNRLIKKADKLYFSKQKLTDYRLQVVDLQTIYWDAPYEPDGVNYYTFEILPFVAQERNPGRVIRVPPFVPPEETFTHGQECLFEIILFQGNEVRAPKTWLQAPSDYAEQSTVLTKEGVPYGGAILAGETVKGNPEGRGPHPLYAYDGLVFPNLSRILSSTLAASVEFRAVLNPPATG